MFTRNPATEPAPIEPRKPTSVNAAPTTPRPSPLRSGSSEGGKSIISNDLKIIGQGLKFISQGTLQVDGEVEGDVAGAEVIIGEQGKVTGTVAAGVTCPVKRMASIIFAAAPRAGNDASLS